MTVITVESHKNGPWVKMEKCLVYVSAGNCPGCINFGPVWEGGLKTAIEKHCTVVEIRPPVKEVFWPDKRTGVYPVIPAEVKQLFPREEIIPLLLWFPFFLLTTKEILYNRTLPFACRVFNGIVLSGRITTPPAHKQKPLTVENIIDFIASSEPLSPFTPISMGPNVPTTPTTPPAPAPVKVEPVVVKKTIPPPKYVSNDAKDHKENKDTADLTDENIEREFMIRDIKRRLASGAILESIDNDRFN